MSQPSFLPWNLLLPLNLFPLKPPPHKLLADVEGVERNPCKFSGLRATHVLI